MFFEIGEEEEDNHLKEVKRGKSMQNEALLDNSDYALLASHS